MVSTSTKRRRRQKANITATAVEDARRQSEVEKRALGTTVTKQSKDVDLFKVDRLGTGINELREKYLQDGKKQKLEAKKLRRSKIQPRRSEILSINSDVTGMEDVSYTERLNSKQSKVEKTLLKRNLKEISKKTNNVNIKPRISNIPGKEDLDLLNEDSNSNNNLNRNKIIKKLSKKQRKLNAVILPDHGQSINPSFQHHQDKLGEVLSEIISKKDHIKWSEDKLKYDPKILEEDKNIDAVTGMKIDLNKTKHDDMDYDDDENDEDLGVRKIIPERKTRAERNKESRKREMQSNIRKKQHKSKIKNDLLKIDQILKDVIEKEEDQTIKQSQKLLLQKQQENEVDQPIVSKIAGQNVRNETQSQPFMLSNELSSNWRTVQNSNTQSLMKDRLLSFERRGMVEPPKVIPHEIKKLNQEKIQESRREKIKRKGKGSTSKISYWREKSRKK